MSGNLNDWSKEVGSISSKIDGEWRDEVGHEISQFLSQFSDKALKFSDDIYWIEKQFEDCKNLCIEIISGSGEGQKEKAKRR